MIRASYFWMNRLQVSILRAAVWFAISFINFGTNDRLYTGFRNYGGSSSRSETMERRDCFESEWNHSENFGRNCSSRDNTISGSAECADLFCHSGKNRPGGTLLAHCRQR